MQVRVAVALAVAAAAILVPGASGVGPWPGVAGSVTSPSGEVRYTVSRTGETTTLRAIVGGKRVASASFDGAWGIPAVTSTGIAGGLSPDGRTLVMSQPPTYSGLRPESKFLLVSTRGLVLEKTLTLPGEFGFDALSPDGRTMFVIQHASTRDLISYRVRAYDLAHGRLLPGVIVAKGETASMSGYPVARATSKSGAWVYTLYHRMNGKPFVHALGTMQRRAVCIDLKWQPPANDVWSTKLRLSPDGRRLLVRSSGVTVVTIDTTTFR
jgi:hypothetical protein